MHSTKNKTPIPIRRMSIIDRYPWLFAGTSKEPREPPRAPFFFLAWRRSIDVSPLYMRSKRIKVRDGAGVKDIKIL
jgi:hypothetical protein